MVYGDRPLCVFRRPLFISRALAGRYRALIAALHHGIRAAREMIEADGLDGRPGSLARRLGISPQAIALATIDPGYPSAAVLARLDTFSADGEPMAVELNAESPAGMGYADALADLFTADPLLHGRRELTTMRCAEAAAQAVVETWRTSRRQRRPARVALVDFLDVPTRPEFSLMQRCFARLGHRCDVADPPAAVL